MKFIKGFLILLVTILMGSCFDPPEYPNTPEITLGSVQFFRNSSSEEIKLSIDFRDGDGDLGLDPNLPEHSNAPYEVAQFFVATPSGELRPATVVFEQIQNTLIRRIEIESGVTGTLATPRVRKNPLFTSALPSFSCVNYEVLTPRGTNFYLLKSDEGVLDKYTVRRDTTIGVTNYVLLRQDSLYLVRNPNHFNIDVTFFEFNPADPEADNEGWVEFDFRRRLCTSSYDGRFPVLRDLDITDAPLEGTLTYTMASASGGFSFNFSVKTLKLRIQIRDRALNASNVIETNPFTLDQILANR
jgi:hypothetical protein